MTRTVVDLVPLERIKIMQTNPVKVIREHCIECCGGSASEVKLCPVTKCRLHPFRLGKNPYRTKREMTAEQKEAAKIRLANARKQKGDV